MKNLFKLFTLVLVVGLALSTTAWGQLLVEDFDYTAGDLLTDRGWGAHSGAGTQAITVNNGGLSYTGYLGSGIGNAALVDNTGEDVNRTFTAQTEGTIYYSFLIQVTNPVAGYFTHLMTGTTSFVARVFVQPATGGFNFGLSNTSTATYATGTVFSLGTTYLCIVKYDFTTTNVNLWVFSSGVPATEVAAGTPLVSATGTGQSTLNAVALRQYSATQNYIVDGIRVGTTWDDAPLPIQLASFVGSYVENGAAKLMWETVSEVNNYGFNVQRQSGSEFVTIGFVEGKGMPSTYEYIDAQAGTTYRLEQIDNDGLTTYYGPIMLNPNSVGDNVPAVFALNQNYPNPFNPSTVINYQLATDNYTTLKVYNLIGKEVATLVNGYVTAGSHQVTFDGSHLTSGMYFYKLQSGNNVEVKKLTLVK